MAHSCSVGSNIASMASRSVAASASHDTSSLRCCAVIVSGDRLSNNAAGRVNDGYFSRISITQSYPTAMSGSDMRSDICLHIVSASIPCIYQLPSVALNIRSTSSLHICWHNSSCTSLSICELSKSRYALKLWSMSLPSCLVSMYFRRTVIVSLVLDAYASSVTACGDRL